MLMCIMVHTKFCSVADTEESLELIRALFAPLQKNTKCGEYIRTHRHDNSYWKATKSRLTSSRKLVSRDLETAFLYL